MKSSVDMSRRAAILMEAGHFSEAESILERILGENPADGLALYMLGTIYSFSGKNGLAIPYLGMAASLLRKGNPEARIACLTNLSLTLRKEGHYVEADKASQEVLAIDPNYAPAWNNLASSCVNYNRAEEGEKYARKSLELEPSPEAGQNLAQCLLEQGKWAEAWDTFEWRFKTQDYEKNVRPYKAPIWDGKPVDTLLIHGEQGLGDEILFLTMAREAQGLCKRMIIEANGRLKTLLRRSLGCEVCANPEEVETLTKGKYDAQIAMGSLGRFFRRSEESFSNSKPYLIPDKERVAYWRKRVEAIGPGPYIAFAWKGGTRHTHEKLRNPPLDLLTDIINQVPATFVSIQYTKGAAFQAELWGISHWQEAIDDMDEQAALIAACDMTVSVAQTALHISGAMGKKTIVLVGSKCPWVFNYEKPTMRWYESVSLIRQTDEDWKHVIRTLIDELSPKQELMAAE